MKNSDLVDGLPRLCTPFRFASPNFVVAYNFAVDLSRFAFCEALLLVLKNHEDSLGIIYSACCFLMAARGFMVPSRSSAKVSISWLNCSSIWSSVR